MTSSSAEGFSYFSKNFLGSGMFKLKKHSSFGRNHQVVFENAQLFDTFFIRSTLTQDMQIIFTDSSGFDIVTTIGGWSGKQSVSGTLCGIGF